MNIFRISSRAQTQSFTTQNGNELPRPQQIEMRQRWEGPNHFLVALIGNTIGLGNLWRFPYLCYTNGGGSFLLCYIIAIILVGLPYFFLELAVGQFMQSGMLGIWQICPLFKGVGYAMVILSFYGLIYYIVVLAWALLYVISTIQMPWRSCGHSWNTEYCIAATCRGSKCSKFPSNETVSSVQEFWERRLLQISEGIEYPGNFQLEIVISLLLMWICCYFCIWKGITWNSKILYGIVLAPYVLLTFLLFRAVLLPGATNGIKYLLMPDTSKLLSVKVWYEATTQTLYSLGVGFGTLQALASFNDYHNDIFRHAVAVTVIEFCTNLFMSLTVFSILGFTSSLTNKPFSEIIKAGVDLVFIIYPTVVLELPWAMYWTIIFFLIVIMLGIDSQFCMIDGFITALWDEYDCIKYHRKVAALVLCAIEFILGLFCVTQGGIYIFYLLDGFAAAGWNVITIVFLEGITIAHIYGIKNFYLDLEDMLQYKPSIWWKICWFVISPVIMIAVVIFTLISFSPPKYSNYVYPVWAIGIGWLLSLSSVVCIPAFMLLSISRERGSLRQRLKSCTEPSYSKNHPRMRKDTSAEEDLPAQLEIMGSQFN